MDREWLKASVGGIPTKHTFTGVPVSATEKRELLFSLPRFITQAEKRRLGGCAALTAEQQAALGTIK